MKKMLEKMKNQWAPIVTADNFYDKKIASSNINWSIRYSADRRSLQEISEALPEDWQIVAHGRASNTHWFTRDFENIIQDRIMDGVILKDVSPITRPDVVKLYNHKTGNSALVYAHPQRIHTDNFVNTAWSEDYWNFKHHKDVINDMLTTLDRPELKAGKTPHVLNLVRNTHPDAITNYSANSGVLAWTMNDQSPDVFIPAPSKFTSEAIDRRRKNTYDLSSNKSHFVNRDTVINHLIHEIGHKHMVKNDLAMQFLRLQRVFATKIKGYTPTSNSEHNVAMYNKITAPSAYAEKNFAENYAESYAQWHGPEPKPTPFVLYAGKRLGWTITPKIKDYASKIGFNLD